MMMMMTTSITIKAKPNQKRLCAEYLKIRFRLKEDLKKIPKRRKFINPFKGLSGGSSFAHVIGSSSALNIGERGNYEVALKIFRDPDTDISKEAVEIQEYIVTLESLPKATMLDLFQRRYLHSFIIGVRLMVCQQFGGINGIHLYERQFYCFIWNM
ncbi:hypothetical protein ACFE04_016876 [Oxalis oulophora]